MSWKYRGSEDAANLKLFQASWAYWENPRNDNVEKTILLKGGDSVNIVACTAKKKIVFVEQFRFGTAQMTLELPGGLIDPGEDPLTAAMRELREETGYTASSFVSLGKIASNPVFMDAYIHHFWAENVELTHNQDLDPGEAIRVKLLDRADVKKQWQSGAFMHPHVVNALLRYFHRK